MLLSDPDSYGVLLVVAVAALLSHIYTVLKNQTGSFFTPGSKGRKNELDIIFLDIIITQLFFFKTLIINIII